MYHGYHFFALFFAISVDLWWGGNGALLLAIENSLYVKLMSSACYASNSIVQFNHKGFVICSNDLATYVLSGTYKKNRTLFTYYKVCITVTPFSLFSLQFWSTFGGDVMERYYQQLKISLYGKLMSSACYASNSIVQFNHKGFVICSNNLATYVLSGTDKKNRTLFTYYKVCITVTPFSLFTSQFRSTFGGVVLERLY